MKEANGGMFFTIDLKEAERAVIKEISHADLLAQAFEALSNELDTNGNSERFSELRTEYSRKLIAFWAMKRNLYLQAQENGFVEEGEELEIDGETLSISTIGEISSQDYLSQNIVRKTSLEKDEVSVTLYDGREIDSFVRPPFIKAEIRTDPTDSANLIYNVIFHGSFISRFNRQVYREGQGFMNPYVKDSREIDCSSFRPDLPHDDLPKELV